MNNHGTRGLTKLITCRPSAAVGLSEASARALARETGGEGSLYTARAGRVGATKSSPEYSSTATIERARTAGISDYNNHIIITFRFTS
jgi:hypothetical protein